MIYTDSTLNPVFEDQQYIAPDGTKYPANYPKNEIRSLVRVAENPRPDGIVTGFIVNDKKQQVWQTREKTPEEIDGQKQRDAALAASALIKLAQDDLIEKQISKLETTGTPEQKIRIADLKAKKEIKGAVA